MPLGSGSAVAEQVVDGDQWVLVEKERIAAPLPHGGSVLVTRKRPLSGSIRGAVLLLHGFACTRYAWHLSRRSFSAYLASRGYDVWNLELRGHGLSRAYGSRLPKRFEDYVNEDVPAVAKALAEAGHRRFFLLGHSMGGALAYAAAPDLGLRARGVVTLSGVFRWGGGALLIRAATPLLHAVERLHRAVGAGAGLPLYANLVGEVVALNLWAIEAGIVKIPAEGWAPHSIEQPVLREWLKRALDRTSAAILATMGRWAWTGEFTDSESRCDYAARWARCGVPSLVIAGDRDRLADAEADVRPAFEAATGDRSFRMFGRCRDGVEFGHVDLVIGRAAPKLVWPTIGDWLDGH